MKKSVIEVYFDDTLKENDIIVIRNKKWFAVNKSVFLDEVKKNIVSLNTKIDYETSNRISDNSDLLSELEDVKKVISYILGEKYDEVLKQLRREDSNNETNENE